jgi:hypothetical protein
MDALKGLRKSTMKKEEQKLPMKEVESCVQRMEKLPRGSSVIQALFFLRK